MRDHFGSRSTARKSGRARSLTPWIVVALGLCTSLTTLLPEAIAHDHHFIVAENQVASGQEAFAALMPVPAKATLTSGQNLMSMRVVRKPLATPTPTDSRAPQEDTNVEPTPIPPVSLAPQEHAKGEPLPTSHLPSPPRSITGACESPPMSSWESAIFDSINHERLQRGVVALRDHACGRLVAEVRAVDMATLSYFSHQGPDGATASSLLRAQLEYSVAGENLARNNYPFDQSVDVAIESLMESKLHRIVILDRSYSHLGVALSEDEAGMKYYVMIFIAF